MEGGGVNYRIRTVEEVFGDFLGRRNAIIKALTIDVDSFYQQCDPRRENLCLYGFPSGHWVVNLPAEEVPAEIPEPVLGINFARDGMQKRDWLSLVAVHSDTWLLSVAFFFGARFGFNNADRMRLFSLINALPTIYETVFGPVKKHPIRSNKKSKEQESQSKHTKTTLAKEEGEILEEEEAADEEKEGEAEEGAEEEEHEETETFCGACGETYAANEFWICCDVCETWFHGKCVKITPARAEHIKQYRCPSCCANKKACA